MLESPVMALATRSPEAVALRALAQSLPDDRIGAWLKILPLVSPALRRSIRTHLRQLRSVGTPSTTESLPTRAPEGWPSEVPRLRWMVRRLPEDVCPTCRYPLEPWHTAPVTHPLQAVVRYDCAFLHRRRRVCRLWWDRKTPAERAAYLARLHEARWTAYARRWLGELAPRLRHRLGEVAALRAHLTAHNARTRRPANRRALHPPGVERFARAVGADPREVFDARP